MAGIEVPFDYSAALAQADAEVVAIIGDDFLAGVDADLAQMHAAAANRDLETLGRLAHTYKGLAGNFGARPLQEAARSLQQACSGGTFNGEQLAATEHELRALCAALTASLKRDPD